MELSDPLTVLKGVGPAVATKFAQLGIKNVGDLVRYFPRRYEDYSQVIAISKLMPGEVSIRAKILQVKGRYVRRGMHVTEAVASDETGGVRLMWFNQPYRETVIKHDQEYFISGAFGLGRGRLSITNPSVELVSDFPLNTARIVPIYRETKGLNSRQIRAAVQQALPLIQKLPETLPPWMIKEEKLISYAKAVEAMHFPENAKMLDTAKKHLGFEEVFELVLASLMTKYELRAEQAPAVEFDENIAKDFVVHLPFQLTDAQRKTIWQIYQDMQKPHPMNRLVEGDVGSGKTVVAAMAALMVLRHGHQVAFMAPTELLARQHAETLMRVLQPVDLDKTVGLLVGGMKNDQKERARKNIADGNIRFIVGTHALIQESVDMQNLELIIIDEQHRFGVEQRKKLMSKAGHMPHVLSLTATPIPRSLALTLYGELDVSILDTKPAGRQPIATQITSPSSRKQLNEAIEKELGHGRQMFVVCPLIAESSTLDVNSAEKIYEQFSKKDFKHWRIGLLHGKMKPLEKNEVMQKFLAHDIDILVSTTVIEVGVDVPNASVMLIEGAERFGLAQIHQLRGRVGRSSYQGYCYLMMSDSSAPSKRLRALEQSNDGFRLAELDLELRGPGAIYGQMQHGALDLNIAKLTDVKLIAAARNAAQKFIDSHENLVQYSELHNRVAKLQAVTNLN
jgi:ATP-dependent DNA helicase RecG